MTKRSLAPSLALMAAMDLPVGTDVPDWVHLTPGQGEVATYDARGPYHVKDAQAVVAASLADPRGMLIDANHATDIAAPKGGDAPAHGWIKALEARADGIWAQVDWNASGRALLADRAYRGISPVIEHLPDGTVLRILRASLTNVPNFRNLTALNMESSVPLSLNARLATLLGLAATATDDQIVAAIPKPDTALQSQIAEIGTALGVDGGDATAVLAAAQAAKADAKAAKGSDAVVTALQATVSQLTTSLNALTASTTLAAATSFVDGEINKGRVGVKPLRDHYIAMHQQDAARVEKEIGAMPVLGPSGLGNTPPPSTDVKLATQSDVTAAANKYLVAQKAAGNDITFTQAVQAVALEGRA